MSFCFFFYAKDEYFQPIDKIFKHFEFISLFWFLYQHLLKNVYSDYDHKTFTYI